MSVVMTVEIGYLLMTEEDIEEYETSPYIVDFAVKSDVSGYVIASEIAQCIAELAIKKGWAKGNDITICK